MKLNNGIFENVIFLQEILMLVHNHKSAFGF